MDDNNTEKKKAHRAKHSGVKADKKKAKSKGKDENLTSRQRNPKAFAINSAVRAERNFRRKEDITAKKQHIPLVDQTPDEPPPVFIAVVGPPKVGKSTLINNLIKSYTRTNVVEIKGPITIVTSKKRRITLIECNNDINAMIDIAKCADLVLLLCDASFGFEMEIFEFLNICQVHGMPKIMGVLTHLDVIKNAKTLKKRKKELKHRFWTEVYDGAKLFYLSGLIHGEYLRNEIKNLGRFISVMKFRPLTWRLAHSYVVADRVEDITNAESIRQNPKCDREVVLYGYVRGAPLRKEFMVHIAGLGDLRLSEISKLSDPCPLPGTEKKRNLLEKERLLYAPMSGVGGIVYDKDAVYIELHGSHSHKEKNSNPEQDELVNKLIEKKQTMDVQVDEQEFRLFSDGDAIKSKNFIQDSDESENDNDADISDDEDSDSGVEDKDELGDGWKAQSDDEQNNDDDSSDEDYQEPDDFENSNDEQDNEYDERKDDITHNNMKWKDNIAEKAMEAYLTRQSDSKNLMKLVYGDYQMLENNSNCLKDEADEFETIGGLFKRSAQKQSALQKEKDIKDEDESCFFEEYTGASRNWLTEENKLLIKDCFVTGKWKPSEDAEELLKLDDLSDADSEVYGDFEDLETGKKHVGEKNEQNDKIGTNESNDEASRKRKMTRVEEENLTKSELMAKKMKLKEKFDAEYDNAGSKEDEGRIVGDHQYYDSLKAEAQRQTDLNKSEFANLDEDLRIEIEGYRAGMYVRLEFKDVAPEFIENLDPTYPILIGGLNMTEENVGYISCKVKKHRWYKKILKTSDPLIISMGWRRFQTCPIYAKIEDNLRHRYLKYTPNHITCSMTFWGPTTPSNTGFLALQSVNQDREELKRLGFRIAATGCVSDVDKSAMIMKKLKLVGVPFKIYKKTAFIKGMFNSNLEVAKFEGAKIKTVSGIRGQIKKAHNDPPGSFRATFEDRILLSSIVFCRTWFRVEVPKLYVPITSLLLSHDQKTQWQGMKTLGQLKREKQLRYLPNTDSLYKPVESIEKVFKPLSIPKKLQKQLPYEDKPKHGPINKKKELERIAVIRSPHEQKIADMMKMIETNYEDKKDKDRIQKEKRISQFKLQKQHDEERKSKREKEIRKKVSRALSKMRRSNKT